MASKRPTPTAGDAEPMVRIKPLTTVRHNGQDMPEAQVLEVNASAAYELVSAGLAVFERADPAELTLAQPA